jgi:integrase
MASIEKRGKSWRAIVRRKGETRRTATFPTKGMAQTWVDRVEREIAERKATGASTADTMTLGQVVSWYAKHASELAAFGRSKKSDLKRLQTYEIADRIAGDLRTQDYVRHAEQRRRGGAGPATVLNDLVWLRQVIKAARASLGLNAKLDALDDATSHLRSSRVVAKAKVRKRRLRDGEEAKLLAYFSGKESTVPMADVVLFALATARRQEEITRLRWADLDRARGVMALDDVKHPRHKDGNRKEFRILPEAIAILDRQPQTADVIFPYNSKTIGALFTRAVGMLGLPDLHFHDLRHEATSRLFERGYAIHEVAQFTLHESWATLKRYANLKPEDVPLR